LGFRVYGADPGHRRTVRRRSRMVSERAFASRVWRSARLRVAASVAVSMLLGVSGSAFSV